MTENQARGAGKAHPYCQAVSGFAVARLSNGEFDWFPAGQPPHINGERDAGATITEQWPWNGQQWRQVIAQEEYPDR